MLLFILQARFSILLVCLCVVHLPAIVVDVKLLGQYITLILAEKNTEIHKDLFEYFTAYKTCSRKIHLGKLSQEIRNAQLHLLKESNVCSLTKILTHTRYLKSDLSSFEQRTPFQRLCIPPPWPVAHPLVYLRHS